MAKIYHYTSIDCLALILSNKTIRFNRLDNVDDLEEGSIKSSTIKIGKYAFVSCWTEDSEESVPLWKMYTNNGIGVRIGLPQDMFKDYPSTKGSFKDGILIDTDQMKLPITEILNTDYIITPFSLSVSSTWMTWW